MELLTVKKDISVEITEKKSVFIGHSFFVTSEEESMEKINNIKNKYSDATHNVWAYSLRKYSAQKCSDDGEPQGTAGLPILSVIKNNEIVDTAIVVTRYFGGILLGAGGLIRAYSKAAALAIETAGKTPILLMTSFSLEYNYDMNKTIQHTLTKFSAQNIEIVFLEKVTTTAMLPADIFREFEEAIKQLYYKDLEIKILNEEYQRKT